MKISKTMLGVLCSTVVLCSACGHENNEDRSNVVSSSNDQGYDSNLIFSMKELGFDAINIDDYSLCQNESGIYGLQRSYLIEEESLDYKIIKLSGEGAGQTIELANNNGQYSFLTTDEEGNFYALQSVFEVDDSEKTEEVDSAASSDEFAHVNGTYATPKQYIVKISSDGTKVWDSPISEEDAEVEYGIQKLIYAKKVGVVSISDSGISIFDTESGKESRLFSSILEEYSSGDYSRRSIWGLRDGNLYLLQTNAQMDDILYKYDSSKKDFTKVEGKYLQEALEGSVLYPGKNYDFLIIRIDGIYAFNLEDDMGTKLCDFNASDLIFYGISYIAEAGDNNLLVSAFETTDGKMDSHYYVLSKGSAVGSEDKQTLTLAVHFASDDIRRVVSAFNKKNSDYKVVIKDYYSDQGNYMDGIESMNLDIVSGNAPDIIVVYSETPFDSYVNKGLIEPLDEYYNSDAELVGQEYFENVLNLGRRNGTLYTIIPKFAVQTCIADASMLCDDVVSFSNYKEICKQRNVDPSMIMGELTKEDAEDLYALSALEFVDVENKTCDFKNQDFYQLLEFVNGLPEKVSDEPEVTIYRDKKAILLPVQIYGMDDYVWAKKGFFDGDVVYNGMPTANAGETFIEVPFQIAMSSTCKDKTVAWEFIRSFLTEEYQSELQCYFPVSEKAFETELKKAQVKEDSYTDEDGHVVEVQKHILVMDDIEVELEPINEAEAKQFYELVKSADKSTLWDEAIVTIISEEVEAYLAGQKSAEEVADIIQSRVSIYLNESK